MRIGYADPPYVGCAYLYADHPDYGGEVDHAELIGRVERDFDGWMLHAAATPLSYSTIIPLIANIPGVRICQWVKPFAAYKRNVPVAYTSEPVFIKAARAAIDAMQSSVVLPSEARTLAGSILPHSLTNETALQYEKRALLALTQHFAMRATAPKRDGYEKAVQDIDLLTGGDGEYVMSTFPERDCRDAEAMKSRIVERFTSLSPTPETGLVEALKLARNRLRAAAINETASGGKHSYEYSEWADEADRAVAGALQCLTG